MRIVWIFGTTVKGASLHRLSSTWAELSRKARYSAVPLHSPTPWRQGRRRRQGRQDAVPCSAIQEITKIVETCWSSVSECVWMGWSLCTVSLFLLENVTVQWLLYCLHNDKMILQSPCKWCFSARSQTPPASFSAAPPLHHQDPSQATAWSCESPQQHWQIGTESWESWATCSNTCWYLADVSRCTQM